MSRGNGPSARAGSSSKQPSSSKKKTKKGKSQAKGTAFTRPSSSLPTPPTTPRDKAVPDIPTTSAAEGAGEEQNPKTEDKLGAEDKEEYYEMFLGRLYQFGKAAESGVGVERSWERIVKMDPARISSSLNAAKTRRASEEKRSCGPGCIAHPATEIGGASGATAESHDTALDHNQGLPESLKIALRHMIGPDWSDHLRGICDQLRYLGDELDGPGRGTGAAPNACNDPNCDCSIPLVTTFEIDAPPSGPETAPKSSLAADGNPEGSHRANPNGPTTSTSETQPLTPLPAGLKRPDTPRPPKLLVTPITPASASADDTGIMANGSAIASPLDAALSEVRGKTVSTPRLRELWHLAVRNMPRQSKLFTFRPPEIYDHMTARLLAPLPSRLHHFQSRAAEMARILTSPLGLHLYHLVRGNEDDVERHQSNDMAQSQTGYEAAHIADFGRMAILSLESDIDSSSGRRRADFTPMPFYFAADELTAPPRKRDTFAAFRKRMSRSKPLFQKLYSHVGVVRVDDGVPMAWSVHFVTRKALIYPAVPDKSEMALVVSQTWLRPGQQVDGRCLKRLVWLFECCEDCEKRPWQIEMGKMWTTNQPNAYVLTAHIVQELTIDPSACLDGLDPWKYIHEGQPPPCKTLSEAQMGCLVWHQTQMRIDNFYALKQLSDDLGIVSE